MSAPKPRFYTTSLSASKSIQRIQDRIERYGARSWSVQYEDGEPKRISFVAVSDRTGQEIPVILEAKVAALAERLDGPRKSDAAVRDKARDVAWRQMLAYVEMALEFVENGERALEEAFMADVAVSDGKGGYLRLADAYQQTEGRLALPPGSTDVIDAEFEEVDG